MVPKIRLPLIEDSQYGACKSKPLISCMKNELHKIHTFKTIYLLSS